MRFFSAAVLFALIVILMTFVEGNWSQTFFFPIWDGCVNLFNCTGQQERIMVGAEKCTWGPSYWCSAPENAQACGEGVSFISKYKEVYTLSLVLILRCLKNQINRLCRTATRSTGPLLKRSSFLNIYANTFSNYIFSKVVEHMISICYLVLCLLIKNVCE